MKYLEKEVQVPKELWEFLQALGELAKGAKAAAEDDGRVDFAEGAKLLPKLYKSATEFNGVIADVQGSPEKSAFAAALWISELIEDFRSE